MWENSKNRLAFCKILKILVSSHIVYHEAVHMTEIQTIQSDGTTPQETKADQIIGQILHERT